MGNSADPDRPKTILERSGTLIETDDEVRQALLSGPQGPTRGRSDATVVEPPPTPTPPGRAASPFRPTARPPVPILTVFDDGKAEGEVIRVRQDKFVIGRVEGDLRFPLDGRMSTKHVEISHQVVGGLHRWVLTDLRSSHGMFVRVSRTPLADRAEFLVGNGRYRFEAPQGGPGETIDHAPAEGDFSTTRPWDEGSTPFRPPALSELLGREIGNRVVLVRPEYWIGTDPSCAVCRADDPFCEPRHARVYRTTKGGWNVEHQKTQNGLWLRMAQITVDKAVQFQVGEQRFSLKVP